jgi:hypothetical protein
VLIGLLLAALAAGACAAARGGAPATPIANMASIAGSWRGTLDFGAGEQPCTLTIEPAGRAVLQGSTIRLDGTISVQGGKATYSFPGRSDGTVTLYQDGSKRELSLKGTSGALDVWVTPS